MPADERAAGRPEAESPADDRHGTARVARSSGEGTDRSHPCRRGRGPAADQLRPAGR